MHSFSILIPFNLNRRTGLEFTASWHHKWHHCITAVTQEVSWQSFTFPPFTVQTGSLEQLHLCLACSLDVPFCINKLDFHLFWLRSTSDAIMYIVPSINLIIPPKESIPFCDVDILQGRNSQTGICDVHSVIVSTVKQPNDREPSTVSPNPT